MVSVNSLCWSGVSLTTARPSASRSVAKILLRTRKSATSKWLLSTVSGSAKASARYCDCVIMAGTSSMPE